MCQLGFVSFFFQCFHNPFFVFGTKCFQGNLQLYGCVTVDADKLVVVQFDDIALLFCNDRSHSHQFAWLIRQKNGYGKDPVSLDQADGTYSIELTMTGGSGKASVVSPTILTVENGQAYADITWSSSNYDYMIVAGNTYLNESD